MNNHQEVFSTVKVSRNLQVWQKAHSLTLEIYRATKSFPRDELYGLTNQMRRAAVSTTANIAEGSHRHHANEFRHFLNISQGSNEEVKYYLVLSRDLGLASPNEAERLLKIADEVGAMLYALMKKVSLSES